MSDPLHPMPSAPPDGQPMAVKRSPAIKITESSVRTWVPVIVALAADRLMKDSGAIAVVLSVGAAVSMNVWGALAWLTQHTALRYLATIVPDQIATVQD